MIEENKILRENLIQTQQKFLQAEEKNKIFRRNTIIKKLNIKKIVIFLGKSQFYFLFYFL